MWRTLPSPRTASTGSFRRSHQLRMSFSKVGQSLGSAVGGYIGESLSHRARIRVHSDIGAERRFKDAARIADRIRGTLSLKPFIVTP